MSNDVINNTAPLSWRGLVAPFSAADYQFGHEQSPRHYPFRNGQGHQHTGRLSLDVSGTLYFLNTIRPNMYPGEWVVWRDALFDGSVGELNHPDLGTFDARVVSGSVSFGAERSAGIAVNVSWVESNEDVDNDATFETPDVDVVTAAEALDETMANLGIDYPTGKQDNSLTESVTGALGEIDSLGQSVSGAMNQIKGTIDNIVFAFDHTLGSIAAADQAGKDALAGAPATWLFYAQADMLRSAIDTQIKIAEQKGRPTGSIRADREVTLASMLDVTGGSISDLVTLNPSLLGSPTIPKGTSVTFYKAV